MKVMVVVVGSVCTHLWSLTRGLLYDERLTTLHTHNVTSESVWGLVRMRMSNAYLVINIEVIGGLK